MHTVNIEKCHATFERAIEGYRNLVIELVEPKDPARGLTRRLLAESIAINMSSDWDRFTYELFAACLNLDHRNIELVRGTHKTFPKGRPSLKKCREALLNEEGYLRYKNVGNLLNLSNMAFPGQNNPFLSVQPHLNLFEEMRTVRNHCAHHSDSSRRRILNDVYKPKRWIEPERFLLKNKGRKLREYLDTLEKISQDMWNHYGKRFVELMDET